MKHFVGFCVICVALSLCGSGSAGPNSGVKLALDIQTRSGKRSCPPTYTSCEEITYSLGQTGYYDVMVVVYEFECIRGIEYSLSWPESESWYLTDFKSCADFLIGGNSGPPMDVAQTWTTLINAETDTSGVAVGWLRLWSNSSGTICLDGHSSSGEIRVVAPGGAFDTLTAYNCAGVGDSAGTEPCSE
jgi:hypothetical protein